VACSKALRKAIEILEKILLTATIKGLKRPQGADLTIFRQALADHHFNQDVEKLMQPWSITIQSKKWPCIDIKRALEKAQVNTYTRVGWIDAGAAEGALQKFLTFNTPQKLVLGPTGHKQSEFVDLFGTKTGQAPHEPGWTANDMLDYFSRHLQNGQELKEPRRITYYIYGAGTWKETDVWPPKAWRDGIGTWREPYPDSSPAA